MVVGKAQRLVIIFFVFWSLIGAYLYKLDFLGHRDLFEYITIFVFSLYVSQYIKSTFKIIWLCLLAWNITDEIGVLLSNDLIKYSFLLVPLFFVKCKHFRYLESFFVRFVLYLPKLIHIER
jgi:hypothetical protein